MKNTLWNRNDIFSSTMVGRTLIATEWGIIGGILFAGIILAVDLYVSVIHIHPERLMSGILIFFGFGFYVFVCISFAISGNSLVLWRLFPYPTFPHIKQYVEERKIKTTQAIESISKKINNLDEEKSELQKLLTQLEQAKIEA